MDHAVEHAIEDILAHQDRLITRSQALSVLSMSSMRHLLGRRWMMVLPGVYAGFTGELSQRQRQRAALLYAGPNAPFGDVTALAAHGVRYLPPSSLLYLLIPAGEHRAARTFVAVRRTHRLPRPRMIDGFPHCPSERALVEAAARIGDRRVARAMMADAVQRHLAYAARLQAEVPHLSGRGAGLPAARSATFCSGADLPLSSTSLSYVPNAVSCPDHC
jgi:hypothetical protein